MIQVAQEQQRRVAAARHQVSHMWCIGLRLSVRPELTGVRAAGGTDEGKIGEQRERKNVVSTGFRDEMEATGSKAHV